MPKINNNWDFAQNQAFNMRLQNLSSDPSTPGVAQIYFNTTNFKFWGWNGSSWMDLSNQGTANAYFSFSDGTTTATASGSENFKFRSANNLLSVAVTNGDATHGDNLLLTFNEANINASNIGSGTLPVTRGGTGVAAFGGTNTLLYTSAANTLASLATANNAILTTNGTGVPSFSTTLPALDGSALTNLNGSNISSGTVGVAVGGTGNVSYTIGDILYASGTTALSKLADVATGNSLISGGVGAAPAWGKIGLTTHVSGTLPAGNGGTGVTSFGGTNTILFTTAANTLSSVVTANSGVLVTSAGGVPSISTTLPAVNGAAITSLTGSNISTGTISATVGGTGNITYAVGDLLQASATNTLSRLAAIATGNVLISGGAGVVSSWGKVGLTTHVSGTLPTANGGTGLVSFTNSGIFYASSTSAIGQITPANNSILVTNGTGVPALATTLPSFTMSGNIAMGGNLITGIGSPSASTDVANKGYVDGIAFGMDWKTSVRTASATNVVVTYASTGGTSARGQITAAPTTFGGITLVAGNRIALLGQTTAAQNGIWIVTTLGSGANGVWDRAPDFDSDAEVTSGAAFFVSEGTNAGTSWNLTTPDPIIVGGASGTNLTFAQTAGGGTYTAGTGLILSGTQFALTGQALALHNASTNGIFARTGTGTVANRTLTGTTDRLTVTNGDGVSGNPTFDIASTYLGQSSITTVGTIITGNWNGSTISTSYGGTGANSATAARVNLSSTSNPLPQKYSTDLGDGSTTAFVITHGLGTRDVMVNLYLSSGTYAEEITDVEHTTANTITVRFTSAPATNSYRVVVVG